jgi:hypothetical protein
MKKYLLLAFIAICIGIIIPCKIYAVDISVGATTWYSWWGGGAPDDSDVDPAFLYGPALSVKFNDDFNLTFVYLYGKYDMAGKDKNSGTTFKFKFTRSDADLALNYRLNGYFKAFAGIKYIDSSAMGFDWFGYGPGLGLSCTLPITENIFLLATLSGFHLWGEEDNSHNGKSKNKSYGANSTLGLAYYIDPASTTYPSKHPHLAAMKIHCIFILNNYNGGINEKYENLHKGRTSAAC